ncbi:MAG: cell filamentation protein Fic [Luteitalea sp.]|nr:cell filamentation protein Fic [Luteitalea sp.]
MGDWFSQPVNHFHGRALPEAALPAGYAALTERFDLAVPLPTRLTAIAERHHPALNRSWLLLTPRHRPPDTLEGQLLFALKWEGIDLGVLAALFKAVEPREIATVVRATPTGAFARRAWFLYEWLTGRELEVPDPGKVRAVPVVDPEQQVALQKGAPSPRHKVLDNLPGVHGFCPMIRWTPNLKAAVAKGFDARAREIIGRTRKDLIARAAAFLLLSDSKSSFAIEGERPSSARAARWARAIGDAGRHSVTIDELERLQRVVIGDARFVKLGLRNEGGFVGTHDRETQEPVPDHISARPQDLKGLLDGIIAYDGRSVRGGVDPVAAAAAIAFGFVYVHPFVDGNGRLHRWLIHHVLGAAGYNPTGVVFPISAAILRRIDEYRAVLESYSGAVLPLIEWRATTDSNVEVLNETADYYRYFDATAHAEFLYSCVEQTIERDLPEEVRFLEAFDRFSSAVKEMVEMPDREVERLRGFLAQGHGRLSKRAREQEFRALTNEETTRVEAVYAELFGDSGSKAV